jgi:hypothetical protein
MAAIESNGFAVWVQPGWANHSPHFVSAARSIRPRFAHSLPIGLGTRALVGRSPPVELD